MDELRRLISGKLHGLDWVRFFRSNNATIKAATVQERETFLREYKQEIDYGFSYASQICQVSVDFVRENIESYLDNDIYYSIDALNVAEFIYRIDGWNRMWPFLKNFDEKLIWRYKEEMDWKELLEDKLFHPQFFDEHIDYFIWLNKQDKKLSIWKTLSYYQHLSDDFIDKYEKKLDWELMSSAQPFSEYIMLKYMDKINWETALLNKKLCIGYNVERELRKRELI